MKKYQLPGVYRILDWHKVSGKFFRTKERGGEWETDFVHADEAEHSLALLLISEMVNMKYAVDTQSQGYLPDGHIDKAVNGLGRPSKWSDGQGHGPIESEILDRFPAGEVPPVEEVTYRTKEEMKAFLKTPGSKGWKPVYALNKKLGR